MTFIFVSVRFIHTRLNRVCVCLPLCTSTAEHFKYNSCTFISEADSTRIEELIPDEPPNYEAPPGYDEIVKVASGQSLDAGVAGCSTRLDNDARGGRARGRAKNKSRRRAKSTPGISSSG